MTDTGPEFRPSKIPRNDNIRSGEVRSADHQKPCGIIEDSKGGGEAAAPLPPCLENKPGFRDGRETDAKFESPSDIRGDYKQQLRAGDEKADTEMWLDAKEDTNIDSRDAKGDHSFRGNWKPSAWKAEVKNERDFRMDHKDTLIPAAENQASLLGSEARHHKWAMPIERKNSAEEDGELKDPEEIVGENKLDWKREDKERDKDKKKKEEKSRDREEKQHAGWSKIHVNPSERKESERDEVGRERWDREKEKEKEKKDRVKEKERERKEHMRRERIERDDAEDLIRERDDFEGSKRGGVSMDAGMEMDGMELERKPSREMENWKLPERDDRERKKEREKEKRGGEHERPEKRMREQDKENEDGSQEGDGGGERERDNIVNCRFQQGRRMLRPRGHSQTANREGRSRFRPKDADGNHGTSETNAILYRPGEYMAEMLKLWKEIEGGLLSKNGEISTSSPALTIEVRIPSELVTTNNHQVRGSQLWGTDIYTDDSDLVAVLMHTGYYRPTPTPPPPSIVELRAVLRILPPQEFYVSMLRNSVRSRAWGAASGCSFSIERCRIIKATGGSIELEPCLARMSAVAPTLAPAIMERTMTTRAASSNAYRQQRLVQEVTIQYNLCNEPWMKYSMSIVADRGLKKSQYTSARLRKGEVLYVETHRNRYELSYGGEKVNCNGGATTATSAPQQPSGTSEKARERETDKGHIHGHGNHTSNGEKSQGRASHNSDKSQNQAQSIESYDRYKWARCRYPLILKLMLEKGVPLSSEYLEVLQDNLAWEEIQWSQTGVWVRGVEYPLARAQFLSPNSEDLDD